jgi:hypothetical protein
MEFSLPSKILLGLAAVTSNALPSPVNGGSLPGSSLGNGNPAPPADVLCRGSGFCLGGWAPWDRLGRFYRKSGEFFRYAGMSFLDW